MVVLSGKDAPTAADVEKVLKEAGVKADADKVAALIAALKDKPFHSLVAEGLKAMSSMGSAAPAAGGAPAKAAEKEAEPEPEEDVDMGDLFGGDY